jgi:hypothetical protein
VPDTNPYGEPLPYTDPVVRVADRGPDPRALVAETLRKVGEWDHIDYSQIIADVALMKPTDPRCALCNEDECEPGCPMMRWRGQA